MHISKEILELIGKCEDVDNVLKCLSTSLIVFSKMNSFLVPIDILKKEQEKYYQSLGNQIYKENHNKEFYIPDDPSNIYIIKKIPTEYTYVHKMNGKYYIGLFKKEKYNTIDDITYIELKDIYEKTW